MAGKSCQICGELSGIYPLCKKHLQMKNEGLVVKNEETGLWELTTNNIEVQKHENCVLCGSPTTHGYALCKDCYYNVQDRMDELDKNQNPQKLKDYYYNAKDYAMRIYDEDKIYYQELTMVAITNLLTQLYNDDSLIERLYKDIDKIDESLKNKLNRLNDSVKETEKINEIKANNDKDKAKIKKTQDGHFVESELEIKVDDILYREQIAHAYSVQVGEILERTVICDWYIPILPNKGIYIELWGIKGDDKYNKNKAEKIELYKKHNLKLIEIEYDELKDNTARLQTALIRKIKEYRNEILEKAKSQ